MVVAAEEKELKRLETQVENGGGGAWDYLCLVRKLKARCSHNVLKFGLPILKDPNSRSKLGSDGQISPFPGIGILSLVFFFFFFGYLVVYIKDCVLKIRKKLNFIASDNDI